MLKIKHKRFIDEYMKDFNGRAAAVRVGYAPNDAKTTAEKLLKHPEIKEELEKRLAKLSIECNISATRVLNEIAKIAFMNPNEIFSKTGEILDLTLVKKINITSEKVEHNGETTVTNKKTIVELYDKQKALDQLMRYLSLYNDKQEITVKSTDEKKQELREKLKKVN